LEEASLAEKPDSILVADDDAGVLDWIATILRMANPVSRRFVPQKAPERSRA